MAELTWTGGEGVVETDGHVEEHFRRWTAIPKAQRRVLRGGSWNSKADECRSAYRLYEDPVYRDICFARDVSGLIGFRCVRKP